MNNKEHINYKHHNVNKFTLFSEPIDMSRTKGFCCWYGGVSGKATGKFYFRGLVLVSYIVSPTHIVIDDNLCMWSHMKFLPCINCRRRQYVPTFAGYFLAQILELFIEIFWVDIRLRCISHT